MIDIGVVLLAAFGIAAWRGRSHAIAPAVEDQEGPIYQAPTLVLAVALTIDLFLQWHLCQGFEGGLHGALFGFVLLAYGAMGYVLFRAIDVCGSQLVASLLQRGARDRTRTPASVALVAVLCSGALIVLAARESAARLVESRAVGSATLRWTYLYASRIRDMCLLKAIAGSPYAPEDLLFEMASSPAADLREPSDGFCDLFRHDLRSVLERVARKPALSARTLRLLSGDASANVASTAVFNPAAPDDVLEAASRSDLAELRAAAAAGPREKILLVVALGADRDPLVRSVASWALDRRFAELVEVLHDTTPNDRVTVGRLVSSRAILEELAGDASAAVRAAVAVNPAVPDEVLARLSNDPVESVGVVARRAISLRNKR